MLVLLVQFIKGKNQLHCKTRYLSGTFIGSSNPRPYKYKIILQGRAWWGQEVFLSSLMTYKSVSVFGDTFHIHTVVITMTNIFRAELVSLKGNVNTRIYLCPT